MTDGVKNVYEGMFLVDSATAAADWEGVEGSIKTLMQRAEAEVINLCKWDDRRLAYEIGGHKRGTYVLTYFKAPPSKISAMERDVQLHEMLLRVLILRADHMTEEEMRAVTPVVSAEREEGREGDPEVRRSPVAVEAAEPEDEAVIEEDLIESEELPMDLEADDGKFQ